MLRIAFSNRFETLLDQLIDRLGEERAGPFVAPQIIVPSTAIERRVQLALADRHGICANVEFSYLAQWLWRQIRRLVEDVREDSPFAPEVLAWRVYEAFGDPQFIGEHERLQAYLANADEVMRLDLAQRVAQLIEQYITYRPRFLQNWSAAKRAPIEDLKGAAAQDEAWQAALWRRLAQQIGTAREHPSVAFFRRIENMSEEDARGAGLPQNAHVFCLPAMPPLYLEILRGLSRWTDLHLYVMNPCREYWFEVVDRKRLTWLSAAGKAEHHESGNNLLASWGKQTQAHVDLLLSGDGEFEESASFQPDASGTLLAQVHNSILDLEELPAGSVALAANDRSIEVHVCHSLTRELEVLYDQLLMMFGGPNPPEPGEILVATPNLNDAAPFIDAVFGTAPEGRRIPYAITGQSERRINAIAHALDSLIALTIGRHPASAVFDLLMQAPVAARFALDAEALDSVRDWIEESGIRWGLESAERKDFKLPATADHTFDDGLQRLYLGYAIGEADAHIDGRIGSGNAEGQRAAALGTLWRFVEELRQLRREWLRRRNAQSWRDALNGALARFVAERPEWSEDFRAVQIAISQLHDRMERGGLKTAIPLEVVRAALAGLLDDPGRGGVPGGRVTFSSMSSLRSLPYRVVCAIGMNDGAYPTAGRPLEFDLVALSHQRGDRQRRLDERNIFLDLVLSARERLYLSYTGRSVRDNSRKPPSVLVSEVLDYAVRACSADAAGEDAVRKRLVVEHPLQPFSAEYFDGSADDTRRRSFNTEYCEALEQKATSSALATLEIKAEENDENETAPDLGLPLFQPPLPPPGEEWRTVRLENLCDFFLSPCRYLLRDRLGIALADREEELADDEPFLPDANSRRAIGNRLLEAALGGASEDALLAQARAGNEFPAGPLGDAVLKSEVGMLWRFARGLRSDRAAPLIPHTAVLPFRIESEDWRLESTLGDLRASGLVKHRYDDVRPSDYLAGWIDHLFLCASAPAGVAC
ncbi:MAG TPA: exodeoxyribonuclease V subunit gamma, partial [Burkholderiales bacterium]|nr:exodeoxyribonuclease V subunit gamma [Burkholderiales bacterium]